jgi:hypothetical protein
VTDQEVVDAIAERFAMGEPFAPVIGHLYRSEEGIAQVSRCVEGMVAGTLSDTRGVLERLRNSTVSKKGGKA